MRSGSEETIRTSRTSQVVTLPSIDAFRPSSATIYSSNRIVNGIIEPQSVSPALVPHSPASGEASLGARARFRRRLIPPRRYEVPPSDSLVAGSSRQTKSRTGLVESGACSSELPSIRRNLDWNINIAIAAERDASSSDAVDGDSSADGSDDDDDECEMSSLDSIASSGADDTPASIRVPGTLYVTTRPWGPRVRRQPDKTLPLIQPPTPNVLYDERSKEYLRMCPVDATLCTIGTDIRQVTNLSQEIVIYAAPFVASCTTESKQIPNFDDPFMSMVLDSSQRSLLYWVTLESQKYSLFVPVPILRWAALRRRRMEDHDWIPSRLIGSEPTTILPRRPLSSISAEMMRMLLASVRPHFPPPELLEE
ncbi:hypothetical protein DFS34DRAFT_649352 [Phlyctochytrium arcticum]|nr:hypothetical protein DFS34DRAFT_649352 [Phlyctochytrium arcticum]